MRKIWYFLIPFGFFIVATFIILSSFNKAEDKQKVKAEAPPREIEQILRPPFLRMENTRWTDSVMATLSLDQKIGQLFMIAAYSNRDQKHTDEILSLIKNYHIGGLIFMQGGPYRQAVLNNRYQSAARIPLLMSIDGEWGLSMRLDSTVRFPRQMTLGAVQDDSLIYQMGSLIARQGKRLGLHVNFAPVVDVNNNPRNPVISTRAFGEDRELVARKGIYYMNGMQHQGVLASAKHFPGHGDTDSDSHYTLPIVRQPGSRLDSVELYPFRRLIRNGVGSIMVAHLHIPVLDSTKNTATTLSPLIVDTLLKKRLGFEGLIFTDALNMKGVSNFFQPGELELKALQAGNDVLLFSENVPVAAAKIKEAIQSGKYPEAALDESVRKILLTKQWAGLADQRPVDLAGIHNDINNRESELLNRRITEGSITLLKNRDTLLPLSNLEDRTIASISIGQNSATNEFTRTLSLYTGVTHFSLPEKATAAQIAAVTDSISRFNTVVLWFGAPANARPAQNFGLPAYVQQLVNDVSVRGKKTIVGILANPYVLGHLDLSAADAVLMGYEDHDLSREYTAMAIFGGIGVKGRLPVTASKEFPFGTGISTQKVRFRYSIPEDAGLDAGFIGRIDSIVKEGMEANAFPGAQVVVVKAGTVVLNRAWGNHTYDGKRTVSTDDIYDIASVTKITASLPVLMKLAEDKMIDLDRPLGEYLPEVKGTNKQNLTLRSVLAHQAGLKSWIPFYLATISKGEYLPGIYRPQADPMYSSAVASNLYIQDSWRDTIFQRIVQSPVTPGDSYVYSDLGYYLFQRVIENHFKKSLSEVTDSLFYAPLGMATTTYNPREKFPASRIIPTEHDLVFRKQLVHGYVHDQGAAMLGGVAGHAGLFSNANDLAKLMQTYLNRGKYGGKRYFSEQTVEEFTRQQFCEADNRRAAGFDRPAEKGGGPVCSLASLRSFGHSGFTGTLAWADPEAEIVYIFLSNRVNPNAENPKLVRMNIRTRIQEVIYQADRSSLALNKAP